MATACLLIKLLNVYVNLESSRRRTDRILKMCPWTFAFLSVYFTPSSFPFLFLSIHFLCLSCLSSFLFIFLSFFLLFFISFFFPFFLYLCIAVLYISLLQSDHIYMYLSVSSYFLLCSKFIFLFLVWLTFYLTNIMK